MNYYTGIGSRNTPKEVMEQMTDIAIVLQSKGYTLRSGGADGADTAFEIGAGDLMDIYIPWDGFNGREGINYKSLDSSSSDILDKSVLLAKTVISEGHWNNMGFGAKKLHTRNVSQVLGDDLNTPSKFLICYTDDGKVKGGTATAIKLAINHNIPVFNLGDTSKDMYKVIMDYIDPLVG